MYVFKILHARELELVRILVSRGEIPHDTGNSPGKSDPKGLSVKDLSVKDLSRSDPKGLSVKDLSVKDLSRSDPKGLSVKDLSIKDLSRSDPKGLSVKDLSMENDRTYGSASRFPGGKLLGIYCLLSLFVFLFLSGVYVQQQLVIIIINSLLLL